MLGEAAVSLTEDFFDPLRVCCAIPDFRGTAPGLVQGEAQTRAMRRRDIAAAISLLVLVLPVIALVRLAALAFRL